MLYKQSLKRFGREIITAYSGEDISMILEENPVELVLFDSSLAAQLQASPAIVHKLNQSGPIILLQEEQETPVVKGLAPAAVLTKPVSLDRLCSEVERLLKQGLAEVVATMRTVDNLSGLREIASSVPEWTENCDEPGKAEELAAALEELAAAFRRWALASRAVVSEPPLLAEDPLSVSGAETGPRYLREKEYVCAVCRARFLADSVDEKVLTELSREPDGYIAYQELNPLVYEVLVCPVCLYSARDGDFHEPETNLAARERISRERVGRKIMVGDLAFDRERTLKHAIASFLLAASCYRHYRERDYVGDFFLRASWLCREIGDEQSERENIERALEHYAAAYETMAQSGEAGGRTALCYIIGEVHRKLGRREESLTYFDRVITGESGPASPEMLKLARAQRASAEGTVGEWPTSLKKRKRIVSDELEDEVL
ncbi:MAG: DUF2225 domain-containing protein [Gemmatimonadota bacterium]|nr:DUF2225 domain-containing protein [Gemmatimonadota bacterium]